MEKPAAHPSREELSAYSLGQLPEERAVAIDSHISECEPCCETIVELSSEDTFAGLLQEAGRLPEDLTADHDSVTSKSSFNPDDIPPPLNEHPRYEILGLIGKGGMGDVYKARHRKMERTVALKVINRGLVQKPDAVDRFHREVKAAAQLSHPNIVTAYDADQAGNFHFMVMEYVDGVDLSRTIKDRGALPVAEACDYIRQAAIGLQHAHARGMVHRDIKPHNMMVRADGTVRILDFGLASLAPEALTNADSVAARGDLTAIGAIMGTPDFISPEQAHDARKADIRSDIYSLGATLYFLLAGRPPFADGSVMHKLKSHAQAQPEPLESLRDDIPGDLAAVVSKMIAKDPDERYQTPAEVAVALSPFTTESLGEASARKQVAPSRHTAAKATKEPSRRGPLVAAALAGLVFAFIAAAVFYIQSGKTTLRFEINDSNTSVSFAGETINVRTADGRTFRVDPSTEQQFVVYQDGIAVRSRSLTLRRGQQIAVKINVVDGRTTIASRDLKAARNPKLERELRTALEIQNVDIRDRALAEVAKDAADAGAVDVIDKAIEKMNIVDLRDVALRESAVRLARIGKVQTAYDIAETIRAWSARDEAMAALSKVTGRPYEESVEAKWKRELQNVLSNAAGIPHGQETTTQWLQLAMDPSGSTEGIEGEPLSFLLLKLNPLKAAQENPAVLEDFRFLNDGFPKPSDLAEAMSVSKSHGYVSMIQPEYIKDAGKFARGEWQRTGEREYPGSVEFEAPNLYAGKADFVLQFERDGRMRIVEFTLPNYGITIVRNDQGVWHREAASDPEMIGHLTKKHGALVPKLKLLLSQAAGIPNEQWQKAYHEAEPGHALTASHIRGEPLSLVLWQLDPTDASAANVDVLKDFRLLPHVGPFEVPAGAMDFDKPPGYASYIRPDYIKEIVYDLKGRTLQGNFRFECSQRYDGRINFVVEIKPDDDLLVTEFTLPNYGITIVRDDFGVWRHRPRTALSALQSDATLQGEWELTSSQSGGVQMPPPNGSTVLSLKGNALILTHRRQNGENTESTGWFTIDNTKNPKTMDLSLDGSLDVTYCIYEIQGDTLRICSVAGDRSKRPETFESPADSRIVLAEYRRKRNDREREVDIEASAARIILDQGYTVLDGGKEIGSRHLVVTENDETLSIVEEYSLALQFDGAPLGIVERDVSAVYSVAGDTPLLMRGMNSTKEQGALVMHGTVEFENGEAEMRWTSYTDGGRKLDSPSKQQATVKPPPGPVVLGSTIQVVGPLLLPEDGERRVVCATFNNRVREGKPLVEYEAGCRLKRTSRPEGEGFTITVFEPDSDKPEMTWEYDSKGNCESIQLTRTTVMKPHGASDEVEADIAPVGGRPESLDDFERVAAKWVLDNGGVVVLKNTAGRSESVEKVDDLPTRQFTITLNLDSTAIADAGLKHLESHEGLRKLSLNGTGVTAQGVQKLREALSEECQIDWEKQPDGAAKQTD